MQSNHTETFVAATSPKEGGFEKLKAISTVLQPEVCISSQE